MNDLQGSEVLPSLPKAHSPSLEPRSAFPESANTSVSELGIINEYCDYLPSVLYSALKTPALAYLNQGSPEYHSLFWHRSSDKKTQSSRTSASFVTLSPVPFIQSLRSEYTSLYRRQRVLQELRHTEACYVEFLKLLSESYTGLLDTRSLRASFQIPFAKCLDELIGKHRAYLARLQMLDPNASSALVTSSAKTEDLPGEREPFTHASCDAAVYAVQMTAEMAVTTYLYEEYFWLISVICQLCEKFTESELVLKKGYEHYLEAIQPIDDKGDLSFLSLLQKPAARLGQYRLLSESLLQNFPKSAKDRMMPSIDLLKQKLDGINSFCRQINSVDRSKTLFSKLRFCKPLEFPAECFGMPLYCGTLACVWKSEKLKHGFYGLALFKSALIVFDPEETFSVEFAIPLVCSRIESATMTDGLYSLFKSAFKIVFEHSFALFELYMLGFVAQEIDLWRTKLLLLIDHVNGPYEFDFSVSRDNLVTFSQVPENCLPAEVSLDRFNEVDYNFGQCYFGELIAFQLEYQRQNRNPLKSDEMMGLESLEKVVFLEKFRAEAEHSLYDVWTEELPTVIHREHTLQRVSTARRSFQYLRSESMRFSSSLKRAFSVSNTTHVPFKVFESTSSIDDVTSAIDTKPLSLKAFSMRIFRK